MSVQRKKDGKYEVRWREGGIVSAPRLPYRCIRNGNLQQGAEVGATTGTRPRLLQSPAAERNAVDLEGGAARREPSQILIMYSVVAAASERSSAVEIWVMAWAAQRVDMQEQMERSVHSSEYAPMTLERSDENANLLSRLERKNAARF